MSETGDNGTGQAPEQSEQPPPGPQAVQGTVVGELSEGENNTLKALQATANNLIKELGMLECAKMQHIAAPDEGRLQRIGQIVIRTAKVLGSYQEIEGKAQHVLNEAAKRMAIPEGQTWQVTPEGKAIVFDKPEAAPPA
jgi:hypothetical protein